MLEAISYSMFHLFCDKRSNIAYLVSDIKSFDSSHETTLFLIWLAYFSVQNFK